MVVSLVTDGCDGSDGSGRESCDGCDRVTDGCDGCDGSDRCVVAILFCLRGEHKNGGGRVDNIRQK